MEADNSTALHEELNLKIKLLKLKNKLQKKHGKTLGARIFNLQIKNGKIPINSAEILKGKNCKKARVTINSAEILKKARRQFSNNYNLKNEIMSRDGRRCTFCKRKDVNLEIDHIKPIFLYPHLNLERSNLRVLCQKCNRSRRY